MTPRHTQVRYDFPPLGGETHDELVRREARCFAYTTLRRSQCSTPYTTTRYDILYMTPPLLAVDLQSTKESRHREREVHELERLASKRPRKQANPIG